MLAERVDFGDVPCRPRYPAVGDPRKRRRRTLQGRALHEVQNAVHAAHLLAAASTARTAVDESRQRRAVSRRFLGAVAIGEQQPPVIGGRAHHAAPARHSSPVATRAVAKTAAFGDDRLVRFRSSRHCRIRGRLRAAFGAFTVWVSAVSDSFAWRALHAGARRGKSHRETP